MRDGTMRDDGIILDLISGISVTGNFNSLIKIKNYNDINYLITPITNKSNNIDGYKLYLELINKIINCFEQMIYIKKGSEEIESTFIKNIILRYLNKIKKLSFKKPLLSQYINVEELIKSINFDFIYDIIVDEVRNIHQSGKIFNSLKNNNPDLYNKLKIVADKEGIDLEGSNKMDDIGFNDNYKYFKKESPLLHTKLTGKIKHETKERGVVLILSLPFEDNTRKIYMGIINKIRGTYILVKAK